MGIIAVAALAASADWAPPVAAIAVGSWRTSSAASAHVPG
jgi:hypothetical protein